MNRFIYNNKIIACPVCESKNLLPIFSKEAMPLYNLERHYNQNSALNAATGKIEFYLCQDCTFVFNAAFDESAMGYSVDYESSRSHSKYFDSYLDEVCKDLDRVLSISNKTVVEVGCGDGQFLRKLRGNYEFKGYGFDPSLVTDQIAQFRDLQFVRGYYTYGSPIFPDIIVLRHVLEHQKNPHWFLDKIIPGTTTNNKLGIYIEIPDWEWIVNTNSIYAFSYEHCSYYSRYSIEHALSSRGFQPEKISFTFDNEYL